MFVHTVADSRSISHSYTKTHKRKNDSRKENEREREKAQYKNVTKILCDYSYDYYSFLLLSPIVPIRIIFLLRILCSFVSSTQK